MTEILTYINTFSSLLLVIATIVYVIFTYKLSQETTKLREVETSPFITVFFRPYQGSHLLELVIKNIGKAPAYSLTINYSDNTKSLLDSNKIKLPSHTYNYLPIEQELSYIVGKYKDIEESEINCIPIQINYKSKDNRKFEETINYNFDYGEMLLLKSSTYKIEKELEQLNFSLQNIQRTLNNSKSI